LDKRNRIRDPRRLGEILAKIKLEALAELLVKMLMYPAVILNDLGKRVQTLLHHVTASTRLRLTDSV